MSLEVTRDLSEEPELGFLLLILLSLLLVLNHLKEVMNVHGLVNVEKEGHSLFMTDRDNVDLFKLAYSIRELFELR